MMMPAPASSSQQQHQQPTDAVMQEAAGAAGAAPAGGSVRRSSSDGGGTNGGLVSPRQSEDHGFSGDDYSDTGSSGSYDDDDDLSDDEETLADRHARSLGSKRPGGPSSDDPAAKRRRRSSSDSGEGGRKRRTLFPTIRRSQRCGKCHTCQNPQLKKACMTVREAMMKEMQGPGSSSSSKRSSGAKQPPSSSSSAAAAAGGSGSQPPRSQQQQQQVLSPAGSADLDQDKYVDLLEPLIDESGGLTNAAAVSGFVATMSSFKTSLSRILPASVLGLTKPSLLADFMGAGGVDTLALWILAAEGEEGPHAKDLLKEILLVMQKLPVTKAFVQSTKSAKVIGSLRKSYPDGEVRELAQQVVKAWMKVIPTSSSSSASASAAGGKAGAGKAAGSSAGMSAAAAAGSSAQVAATKKTTGQVSASGVNGAATGGRLSGSGVQMISDNDLFKPAAPAAGAAGKPKTSLRLGQPKKSGGVQLVDTAEAGKLLSGTTPASRTSAAAAAGSRSTLGQQKPRLASPPLAAGSATPAAGTAGQPRVVLDLQVTPEQTVKVTLRVVQPAGGGRLPGLRRTGFGSSLGQRTSGAASSGLGAVQAAVSGAAWGAVAAAGGAEADAAAAAAPAVRKPRKPKKRVSWKSERELESVRWFVRDDPASAARQDRHLTEAEYNELIRQHAEHHQDFSNLQALEHQNERFALEAHHREEEERRRQAVAAMTPASPWHGTPPSLQMDPEWQVAFGEDSTEGQRLPRPAAELIHSMQWSAQVQPVECAELRKAGPPSSGFNVAHYDAAMKIIPAENAARLQQVPPQLPGGVVQLPLQQPPAFAGQPILLQQPLVPPVQQPPQQQPVTYTLGQALPGQPQLVVQPLQQQQQQQPPPLLQQQQQLAPPAQQQQPFVPPPVSGPPSGGNEASFNLLAALQSLSQSGILQQQPPAPAPAPAPVSAPMQPIAASQVGLQAPPPGQQMMLQPPPPQQQQQGAVLQPPGIGPAGAAPAGGQLVTLASGVQVVLPPGVTPLAGQGPMQLPPGYVLPGGQAQQPPGVVIMGGGPQGAAHSDEGYGAASEFGGPGGPPPWGGGPDRGGPYGRGRGGPDHHDRAGGGGPVRRGGGRGGGGPYGRGGGGGRGGGWQANRLCKFFGTARGCAKGDTCDFKHCLPGADVDVREAH